MKPSKSLQSFLKETEPTINEDINSSYNKLRRLLYSTRTYTFKKWLKEVEVRKWLKEIEELINRLD
jgi:hypothetical protein